MNYAGNKAAAEEVAHKITELGSEALVVGGSVGKREDVERIFKEVSDHHWIYRIYIDLQLGRKVKGRGPSVCGLWWCGHDLSVCYWYPCVRVMSACNAPGSAAGILSAHLQ